MNAQGRILLISGASGIAAETARLARDGGAQVFTVALDDADLNADLTGSGAAARAVAACLDRHGRLDALFNCAGISGRRYGDGPVHECTEEGWDATLGANARSAFLLSRAALQPMMAQRSGSILHMASVLAYAPEPERFATHAYAASKGALIALTKTMAAYYAPYGIRVNAIAPGLVRTPMSARAQADSAIMDFLQHKQPLARGMLDTADVARAALFLLGDDSRHITGQVLGVDAGWQFAT
jgi:NAD(P)-dependent dehydrogenase (short-subunit alcohol dehydrogenase family)